MEEFIYNSHKRKIYRNKKCVSGDERIEKLQRKRQLKYVSFPWCLELNTM